MSPALAVALLANLIWGLSPIYYFFLGALNPGFLLAAQVILTFASLSLVAGPLKGAYFRKDMLQLVPTAALIGMNWLAYLVAVLAGRALDASYGYLIAPILTVLIGQLYFKSPMHALQKLGLAVCILAVAFDITVSDSVPVFGFLIALPFALYVLMHKKMQLYDPVTSLRIETGIMLPFAVAGFFLIAGDKVLVTLASRTLLVLALLGLVNALPLILFVRASARLTPVQLGACQFIAPSASAIVAVTVFGSPFTFEKLVTFAGLAIGMGLAIFQKAGPVTTPAHSCEMPSEKR